MLQEGNLVKITELKTHQGKFWIVSLKKGEKLSTHLGEISHDDILLASYGDTVNLTKGEVALLNPNPRDFIRNFNLKTQILYEDDCAIACSLAGLKPGMRIGEAGTGSGALTAFLAYQIQPDGQIYSFDVNSIHSKNAQKNLCKIGLEKNVEFIIHDIRYPFEISDLDAFFLDFSTPFEAINIVASMLKGGGNLISFVPNWGQVETTVEKINQNQELHLLNVFEITRRNFVVNPERHIMRPVFRDLVYSGILIHATKLNKMEK